MHELNNSQGHEAGDEMLREVALTIRNYFGDTHSYRIGGDEFVAFVLDADMENVAKQSEAIAKKLQASDYYVSIGISQHRQTKESGSDGRAGEKGRDRDV